MAKLKLSKRSVDAATAASSDTFFWDSELAGFGLKVTPSGHKAYVCQYRVGGGRRGSVKRYTIGTHGSPWTPEAARAEAKRILGLAAAGGDPAAKKRDDRAAVTVAELCDRYLAEGCATKKASTLVTDRGRIERHIKPLLGATRVRDLTRADVQRFLQDVAAGKTATDVRTGIHGRAIVRGGRGTATRTVGLLGGILRYAIDCGVVAENVAHGVKRFPDRKSERFLSGDEMLAVGQAFRTLESRAENAHALAIIKLLVFTGARKGEIERLQWNEVDLSGNVLRLGDSKTGQKPIFLNAPARTVLLSVDRLGNSIFVFPATRGVGHFQGVPKVWRKLRLAARIPSLRLHDLRHSFASVALSSGASLSVIGALLGHSNIATTQRYAHLTNDPLWKTSEATAAMLASAMEGVPRT